MKKVIIFIILIACGLGIYFAITYKRVDPDVNAIQEMDVAKYNNVLVYEGRYIEKDTIKIDSILKALKDRLKENNTIRYNIQNYSIYMELKNANKSETREYRYDIFIEKDGIYITMPYFSNKSYKLGTQGEKVIRDFLDNLSFTP